MKVHRKTTDEAISRYLASKLSNDAWNSVIGMQNDTFSVTKPQERRIFFYSIYWAIKLVGLLIFVKVISMIPRVHFG